MKRAVLFLLSLLLPAAVLLAGSESYMQTLSGKIKKGDSCVVVDDKFLHMSLDNWNKIRHLSVQNLITFELRQDTSYFYQSKPFTCTLELEVKYYSSRDQVKPTEINDVKLVVKYDTATGSYYPVTDRYQFKNAFKVVIVVKSISSPEWGNNLPPVFRITNQIFIERKYPFHPTFKLPVTLQKISSPATSSSAKTATQQARGMNTPQSGDDFTPMVEGDINFGKSGAKALLSWDLWEPPQPDPPSDGSEPEPVIYDEYDLEWTFIDLKSKEGTYLLSTFGSTDDPFMMDPVVVSQWMQFNTTRVTLSNTHYEINIPYPPGYVFFRIRGVSHPDETNPNLRFESEWVYTSVTEDNATYIICMPVIAESQRTIMNWQYTGSFAEEGKRKEVISYFDASLRSRQTVTINNADLKAMAAETIYDKMGRAAMQILPAPLQSERLDYHEGVNMNEANEPYNYTNIRRIAVGDVACSLDVDPISNEVTPGISDDNNFGGASLYYSPNNTFLADPGNGDHFFNKYIPDAQKKPFSVTDYTPDNTGRIRKQGGVGPTFQIGTGRETSYYYSKPLQEDLDRIFGTEAGNASHFMKTTIVDPNGQASVSYTNSGGKTVATALVGTAPAALDALPSLQQGASGIDKILVRPADFQRDAGSLQLLSTATFTVANKGTEPVTYHLLYNIKPAAIITSPSQAAAFCSNCYYDVLIEVKNDCGIPVYSVSSEPFPGSSIICSASTAEIAGDAAVEIKKPGEYFVTYRLRLSEAQIQFHEDYYIKNNKDLKQLQAFVTEELAKIDIRSCYSECTTCKEKLGSLPDFTQKMRDVLTAQQKDKFPTPTFELNVNSTEINNWIAATYQTLYDECDAMSGTCAVTSPCDDKLAQMKLDVLPGGQYALYDPVSFALIDPEVNVLSKYGYESLANLSYQDENGVTVYASSLNQEDFIKAYIAHPEWADEIVKLHVEYNCGYLWCVANSGVYAYEDKMKNVITKGADAILKGYYDRTNPYILLNNDPFFSTRLPEKANMQADLAAISTVLGMNPQDASNNPLPAKNILQLVDWILYCKPSSPTSTQGDLVASWQNSCTPSLSCRSSTREWEMYRDYYFQLRGKYIQQAKGPGCNCYIGTDGIGGVSTTCQPLNGGEGASDSGPCPGMENFTLEERNIYEWWTDDNHTYHKTSDVFFVYNPGVLNRTVQVSGTHALTRCPWGAGGGCDPEYELSFYLYMPAGTHEIQIGSNNIVQPYGYPEYDTPYYETWNAWGVSCPTGIPAGNSATFCITDPRYPFYRNKRRIFNDFVDFTPLTNCVTSQGNTPNTPSMAQALRDAALVDLAALKDNWLNTLKGVRDEEYPFGLTLPPPSHPLTNSNLDILVENLYQVAKKNIEISDPSDIRAASTLPLGVVSVNNHNSFQQAFDALLSGSLVSYPGFNEYLLALPYPYNKKPHSANQNVGEVTTDICTNLSNFKSRWIAAGSPETFHKYLQQELGTDYILTENELIDLESKCASSCPVRMLENPLLLPVALTMPWGDLVNCSTVNAHIATFNTTYGAVPPGGKLYRVLLTNYLNHQLGYSLSYEDYIAFSGNTCTGNPNALLYNKALSPLVQQDDFACATGFIKDAFTRAGQEHERYITLERKKFRNNYISTCLANQASMKLRGTEYEYHYTLYYYDQSGNLVKTIPPAGVDLLEGDELAQVETFRGDNAEACLEYNGPTTEDKNVTLNAVSTQLLNNAGKGMEFWLYDLNTANFTRQVRFTTPDRRYFYQLAIHDNKIWVELYSTEPDGQGGIYINVSNQAYADLSTLPRPLQSWTHVMVQSVANTLTSGDDLQLYVDGEKLTTLRTGPAMPPYPFEWEVAGSNAMPADDLASLKQLRLYRRPATDAEVWANYKNQCLTPRDLLAGKISEDPSPGGTNIQSFPLTVWGRFNMPAAGSETIIAGNIEWAGRMILPKHTLPTVYTYNSLNQVVKQTTPDAGTSEFYYDRLGQLVASQNAEQKDPENGATTEKPANRFSYTKYDGLNRIIQTGERIPRTDIPLTTTMSEIAARDDAKLATWLTEGNFRQVTLTAYDQAPSWVPLGVGTQRNLLKRVTASALLSSGTDGGMNREAASYYSYDAIGNVDVLVQENKQLALQEQQHVTGSNGLKKIEYEYDLVSGKVNKVKYQDGKYDKFYYSYQYDAENRLIDACSGRNWLTMTRDARYSYYLHGPLARVELGKNQVQGLDYAYTLQGWLKGVNGQFLDASTEMGNDGFPANAGHKDVARDAMAFSLGYYENDYLPIGRNSSESPATAFAKPYNYLSQTPSDATGKLLFNGNISHSTYAIAKLRYNNGMEGITVGYTYRYDQLNRLLLMKGQGEITNDNTVWGNNQAANDYREEITYDANGNITTLKRNAATTDGDKRMDDLAYGYTVDNNGKLVNNRLRHVKDDPALNGKFTEDIDTQPDDNYRYDKIGNLIKENSDEINWTVYGKISGIVKSGGNSIIYKYDAGGNRITKINNTNSTHYVRDAQGNVLGVYGLQNSKWDWQEQHLYGSSRLGILREAHTPINSPLPNDSYNPANDESENARKRLYELSNHLGNVLATVYDQKTPVDENNDQTTDYFTADIVNSQDYYPFGMFQPGRSWVATGKPLYRYGFNGKENDNDVKGEGNQQDYGMRIYDPRLGKFLSVDPLTKEYPELTPYQFSSNSPIENIDLDGLEKFSTHINGQEYAVFGPLTTDEAQKRLSKSIPQQAKATYAKNIAEVYKAQRTIHGSARTQERVNALTESTAEMLNIATTLLDYWSVGFNKWVAGRGLRKAQSDLKEIGKMPTMPRTGTQDYENHGSEFLDHDRMTPQPLQAGSNEKNYYRGGGDFTIRDRDIKIDPQTGLLKTTHGISLNTDPNGLDKFGGAYRITNLPKSLKVIQRGKDENHYEVVPGEQMSKESFQKALNEITTERIQNPSTTKIR
jgi:RHS repeat-associated protein